MVVILTLCFAYIVLSLNPTVSLVFRQKRTLDCIVCTFLAKISCDL